MPHGVLQLLCSSWAFYCLAWFCPCEIITPLETDNQRLLAFPGSHIKQWKGRTNPKGHLTYQPTSNLQNWSLYFHLTCTSFSILASKPWKASPLNTWQKPFPYFRSLWGLSHCQKHFHNFELVFRPIMRLNFSQSHKRLSASSLKIK